MTRRDFLATSAAAAVLGRRTTLRAWQQQPAPLNPVFTPIRRNVGYFTCRGGTIGYLINSGIVVAVDSQYPNSAALCIDGLKERAGGRGIDILFNTHHHADHTGGNGAFKAVTKTIVAQTKVPALQKEAAAQAIAQAAAQSARTGAPPPAPVEQVYADSTFEGVWNKAVGDEVIHASYAGPAHTGGDITVHFEKANVVHVGDLVWNRLQTFVDRPGGASALNWIVSLEQIAKKYPSDAVYVFGHAGTTFPVTGSRAEVLLMRDYMTALVEYVRAEIKAGKSRDEIIASTAVLKGFEDYKGLTTRALTGTYDELVAKTPQG
jgi:glyoxylase-like metal-dependent hydrolase (beta-lactamase superfamily II)